MVANTFIDNAKVMAKGQITIPKDIREILGISSGDRVTFVVENGNVQLIIPVSKMICQQINAIVKVEANHLANKYAREYNKSTNYISCRFCSN